MAEIFNISDRFKKPVVAPTLEELVRSCSEEIADAWQSMAKNNQLNDYFVSNVMWADAKTNYMGDLTAISVVESKINIVMSVHSPSSVDDTQIGWMATFKVNGMHVNTPFMPFEAYARCFNILLFLKLSREAKNHSVKIS